MKNGLSDIFLVLVIFTPLVLAVTPLLGVWLIRTRDSHSRTDGPERLLVAAVRLLPQERRGWGVAMLAELAPLQHPSTRWRFALGCTHVALFPPRKGGLLQTMMNNKTKRIITTFGAAALISFILVLPFAILESLNQPITKQNAPGLILLFGVLWLLPTAFIFILVPIVRAVRAGDSLLAHPLTLLFKVAILVFLAWFWGSLFIDQLPCFLGVPNCD